MINCMSIYNHNKTTNKKYPKTLHIYLKYM